MVGKEQSKLIDKIKKCQEEIRQQLAKLMEMMIASKGKGSIEGSSSSLGLSQSTTQMQNMSILEANLFYFIPIFDLDDPKEKIKLEMDSLRLRKELEVQQKYDLLMSPLKPLKGWVFMILLM